MSGISISLSSLIQNNQLPADSSDIGCISVPDDAVLNIDTNYTFSSTTFYMGLNSRVVIKPSYQLTLHSSCIFESCSDTIWNGILLQAGGATTGGKLDMSNSRIYDAVTGVEAQHLSRIRLVNNHFIDNNYGLKIRGHVVFINFSDKNDFRSNTFYATDWKGITAILFDHAYGFTIGEDGINPPVVSSSIYGYIRGIHIKDSYLINIFGMYITEMVGYYDEHPLGSSRLGIINESSTRVRVKYCKMEGLLGTLIEAPYYGIVTYNPGGYQVYRDNNITALSAGIIVENASLPDVQVEIENNILLYSMANIVVQNFAKNNTGYIHVKNDSIVSRFHPQFGKFDPRGNIQLVNIGVPYQITDNVLSDLSIGGPFEGLALNYCSGNGQIAGNHFVGHGNSSRRNLLLSSSRNVIVKDNIVEDSINANDSYIRNWGILAGNCQNTEFCCNSISGTDYGIQFQSANNDIRFLTTTFGVHDSALYFPPATSLNAQYNTGNDWSNGSTTLDAYYNGSLVQARKNAPFRTSSSNINASLIEPSGWFILNGSDPYCGQLTFTCASEISDTLPSGLTNADSTALTAVENGNEYVLRFEQQRQLFRKLKENPDLVELNEDVTEFYNQADTGIVGAFDAIDEGLRNLFTLSPTLISTYMDVRDQLDSLSALTEDIRETYPLASAGEQENMLEELEELAGYIETVQIELDTLYTQADSEIQTNVTELLAQNDSLNAEEAWETNEKDINALFFKYLGGMIDTFTATELTQIETLAYACPQFDGAGVYKARFLYQTFVDSTFNGYYENHCIPEESKPTSTHQPSTEGNFIAIHPNPASSRIEVHIIGPSVTESKLILRDLSGRIMLSKAIETTLKTSVDLNRFAPGIYLLSWYSTDTAPM